MKHYAATFAAVTWTSSSYFYKSVSGRLEGITIMTYLLLTGAQRLPLTANQSACLGGLDSLEVSTGMSVLEEKVVRTHSLYDAIVMKLTSVGRLGFEATCKFLSQLGTCIVGESDLICGVGVKPGLEFGFLRG